MKTIKEAELREIIQEELVNELFGLFKKTCFPTGLVRRAIRAFGCFFLKARIAGVPHIESPSPVVETTRMRGSFPSPFFGVGINLRKMLIKVFFIYGIITNPWIK